MPTRQNDKDFNAMLNDGINTEVTLSTDALDMAIHWIQNNLNPDDVFSEKDLSDWAESNGYIKQ